uniref:BTB_2 domain-containing protein n=1 Tax=Steinernema glaseri TaxID=37863 RepID=A0A1I7ZIP5_9BILA
MNTVEFNVGGKVFVTTYATLSVEKTSNLYSWYVERCGSHHKHMLGKAFFIDRDAQCFGIVLNYLRLKAANQRWEACLPKDPDRLALLTQEAEYYELPALRDQAVALLQHCSEKNESAYVNEILSKSFSCPQGFD